ncbi:hypothetical protein [Streptomyces sp. NPDC056337]
MLEAAEQTAGLKKVVAGVAFAEDIPGMPFRLGVSTLPSDA